MCSEVVWLRNVVVCSVVWLRNVVVCSVVWAEKCSCVFGSMVR